MCGRFSQAYTWEEVYRMYESLTLPDNRSNLQPRYNIAPTTEIDIIVRHPQTGETRMIKARWGLVPPWHKGPLKDFKLSTINARAEEITKKSIWSRPFKSRRCIIPASGFFEWTTEGKEKIPHFFSASNGSILAFAGLWDRWTSPEGEEIMSATIIVKEADAWTKKFHDRMPMMLRPEDFDHWLSGTAGEEIFEKPGPEMREWIVSQRVNKAGVGNDDPSTIEPTAVAHIKETERPS